MSVPTMSADWQKKLESFGLVQNGGAFDYKGELTASDALCTLASDALLHVSGEDAGQFLEGQLSNDIAALENPGSQLSTWSSHKGRVISLFRVIRIQDGYLIKLPHDQLDVVSKRLTMLSRLPVNQSKDLMKGMGMNCLLYTSPSPRDS